MFPAQENQISPDISYPLGGRPSSSFEADELECVKKAIGGVRFGSMLRLAEGAGLTQLLLVK
jgi:hypothetical protein